MLSVEDLLQTKHLNLRLLNPGPDTVLSSPVHWAHPTEMPDPAAWLPEHSIILTLGSGLHASPKSQRKLVRHAILRQCSAIGFGLGLWLDSIPELIKEEANQNGLPLIEVPYEVSFAEVIKTINQHNFFEQNRPLFNASALLNALIAAQTGSTSIESFLRTVAKFDPFLGLTHFRPAAEVDWTSDKTTESEESVPTSRVLSAGVYIGEIESVPASAFMHEDTKTFYVSMLSLFLGQKTSELAHHHFRALVLEDARIIKLFSHDPTPDQRIERFNTIKKFIDQPLVAATLNLPTLQAAIIARWIIDQLSRGDSAYFSAQKNNSIFLLARPSESLTALIDRLQSSSTIKIEAKFMPVHFHKPDTALDCFRELFGTDGIHHEQTYFKTIESFFDFVDQSTSSEEKSEILNAICPHWPKLKGQDRNFIVSNLEIHLRLFGQGGKISKTLRISRQSWYQRLSKLQYFLSIDIKNPLSVPPLWSFLTIASKAKML